ncbi:30695_t:CDS:2, partial [Racocetra persica]
QNASKTSKTSNISKLTEENFACTTFSHLSLMYQIMVKHNIAHVQLFKTAEGIVDRLSDDVIFDATFYIGDFKQPELVELLNRLCEDIILHILTKLQENIPNIVIDDDEIVINDNFHKTLLASSKFWVYILKAIGSIESISQHAYVRTTRQAIIQLAGKLLDKSIEMKMLKNILDYDDNNLLDYFSTIDESTQFNINETNLQYLRSTFESYINKLIKLDIFYKQFCMKTINKQDYISDITAKIKLQGTITLEDTLQKVFWEYHQPNIEAGQRSYIYRKSQTFKNVFEKCLETNEMTLTVELVATKYISMALSDYDRLRSEFNNWTTLEYSNISMFWKDVKNIDHELELMSRGMTWKPKNDLRKAISYLIHIKSWRERLEDLERTLGAFKVQNIVESWVVDTHNRLLKEPLMLLDLKNVSDKVDAHLDDFDDNCWAMIGALSYAGDFISWLQIIAEGDLRNLINGVDDKREIHEETVASLIEVKQFLVPLMNDMVKLSKEGQSTLTIITKFLDNVHKIISKNESLHEKIKHCCSSSLALQNIYFSIVNRGEATKERIRDAATKGSYKFYRDENHGRCTVNLVCKDKSGKINSYDLLGLQDLQGQALLIAKQAASAFVLHLPVEDENNLEQGTKELMEFVNQVDTVHQIVKYASKLMELGHFAYREWNMSANSAKFMTVQLEKLKKDLQSWEDIMQRAHEEHYYLTFYTARNILIFYDYFSCKGHVNPKTRETCELLLRLVNKQAKLLPNRGDIIVDMNKMNYYEVLCQIGQKLHEMITLRFEYPKPIKAKLEPIASDVVYQGKLFVAACADNSRVPNIIMSLYANHKFYPKSWQLLICRNTTTEEEISIFIKRCFLAARNGYGERLFCIASLEFLEFELQY